MARLYMARKDNSRHGKVRSRSRSRYGKERQGKERHGKIRHGKARHGTKHGIFLY
jgi:hypothetical protein